MGLEELLLSFSPWFKPTEDNCSVICLCGSVDNYPKKSSFLRHFKSKRHRDFMIVNGIGIVSDNMKNVEENCPDLNEHSKSNLDFNSLTNDAAFERTASSTSSCSNNVNKQTSINCKNVVMDHHYNKQCLDKNMEKEIVDGFKPVAGNDDRVTCVICNEEMFNNTSTIGNHLKYSKTHLKHLENNDSETDSDFDVEVETAKIKFVAMGVFLNLSFLCLASLMDILKVILFDSEILKKIRTTTDSTRHQISDIGRYVIAPAQKEWLTPILKSQEFSISIDESTDINNTQVLCIIVRFVDYKLQKVRECVWDVLRCRTFDENGKYDAEYCFNQIINSLKSAGIPLINILSFCADTCNMMMGKYNSVASRFKKMGVKIIKCNCHIEHLAAKAGIKVFPEIIKTLVSSAYQYISDSSRRKHNFKVLQNKVGLKNLNLLKHVAIRWLSFYNCIRNILRRWTAHQKNFEFECNYYEKNKNEKVSKNFHPKKFFDLFSNDLVKASYIFLEAALSRLVVVNVSLQSEKTILPQLQNKMATLYTEFLGMFMKKDYVDQTNINNIDIDNTDQYKNVSEVYIGKETESFLLKDAVFPKAEDSNPKVTKNNIKSIITAFRFVCREYYIEVCKVLKEKCDFTDSRYVFHPDNVFTKQLHDSVPTLDTIFQDYQNLKASKDIELRGIVNDEWNLLANYQFSPDLKNRLDNHKTVDEFWFILFEFKDSDGNGLFQNVAQVALTTFCAPNSNAAPERFWSKLKNEQPPKRGNLSFETLRGILLSSQYIKDTGGMHSFTVTPEMLKRMQEPFVKEKPIEDGFDKSHYGNIELTPYLIGKMTNENLTFINKFSDLKRKSNVFEHDVEGNVTYNSENSTNSRNKRFKKNIDPTICLESIENPESTMQTDEYNYIANDEANEITELEMNYFDNALCQEVELCNDIYLHSEDVNYDCITQNCSMNFHDYGLDNNLHQEVQVSNEVLMNNEDAMDHDYFRQNCRLNFNDNGLVSNYLYYLRSASRKTVGRFKSIDRHPFRDHRDQDGSGQAPTIVTNNFELDLFALEYQTLQPCGNDLTKSYLDGDVIDAVGCVLEKNWENAVFILSRLTSIMLIDNHDIGPDWFMFHLNCQLTGKIFLPYVHLAHWCLCVIDMDDHTFTHINPSFVEDNRMESRALQCFIAFSTYLNHPSQKSKFNLKNNWRYKFYRSRRPIQTDGYNCGIYILYYMDCIGRGIDFNLNFNPDEYRIYVSNLLLRESLNMKETCLFCFSIRDRHSIICYYCKRFSHTECLKHDTGLCIVSETEFLCSSCKTELFFSH